MVPSLNVKCQPSTTQFPRNDHGGWPVWGNSVVDDFDVGFTASTLNQRIVTVDHNPTATFVLNGGHWIDAKINSGHSRTEIALSLCGALVQRVRSFRNGSFQEVQLGLR